MAAGELSSGQNCVRLLFIVCNIPILLFGLAALGIGIWQIIVDSALEEVLSDSYTTGGAIFVVAGSATVLVAIIGVIGAYKKYKYLLLTYLAVIFLVITLQVIVFGYAIAKADDIDEDSVGMDLMRALDRYYSPNDTANYDEDLNDVVDLIQESLECCGINNTEDWMSSPYYEESMRVPSSCCDKDEPAECEENEIYQKGCQEALTDYLQDNLYTIVGVAIAFAVFELALLVMSFYLFMAVNNATLKYERV